MYTIQHLRALPGLTGRRFISHNSSLGSRMFLRSVGQPTLKQAIQRRNASSTSYEASSLVTRMKNLTFGTSIVLAFVLGYFYITDTRASVHRYVVVPVIRLLYDAEDAHHFGTATLKGLYQFGLHPRERSDPDKDGKLITSAFGYTLVNPIGISGGLDKDADIPNPLFALGPAIVEVGGTTPLPQPGNARERVFRVPSQNALINRYGLNSLGADNMAIVLRQRVREYAKSKGYGYDSTAEQRILDGEANVPPGSLMPGRLLAVQIAKNKTTPEHDVTAVTADYVYCVERLARYADILVVNVSSPNTPGLRSLQATGPLTKILTGVVNATNQVDRKNKPAVMVKVSPDEDTDEQIAGICKAVWESGVDGVIVGNTTKRRPDPLPNGYKLSPIEEQVLLEQGGYSGPQLFGQVVKLVKKYRTLLKNPPESPSYADTAPEAHANASQGSQANKETSQVVIDTVNRPRSSTSVPVDAHLSQLSSRSGSSSGSVGPKVIFATGGISNGSQAIEVLDAGASVAMVYTALVYGGVGTISRIKQEMKDLRQSTKAKNA